MARKQPGSAKRETLLKMEVIILLLSIAVFVILAALFIQEPQPLRKTFTPSKAQTLTRKILDVVNEAKDTDPHPETHTYLKEFYRERVAGKLLIIVENRHKEESGKVFVGVAGEYIRPEQSKSGKHEIHVFVPEFERYQSNQDNLKDAIISLMCHELMHLETYRVYGKLLAEHPDKPGFVEFLVWTNQIRSQLVDWKKQGRFLTQAQREAVAAYERYGEKDEKAWMKWVQEHLLY